MINLTELAITFIIVVIGGKIQEGYKPDQLELHLSNGGIEYISINKKYSCPRNCNAIHYHETIVSNSFENKFNYKIYYDDSKENLKLNDLGVVNIFEIKKEKKKRNKNVSTKKEKVEINNFIKKFNL